MLFVNQQADCAAGCCAREAGRLEMRSWSIETQGGQRSCTESHTFLCVFIKLHAGGRSLSEDWSPTWYGFHNPRCPTCSIPVEYALSASMKETSPGTRIPVIIIVSETFWFTSATVCRENRQRSLQYIGYRFQTTATCSFFSAVWNPEVVHLSPWAYY